MNQKEFNDRTKQFLSEEDIARYESSFEPAYMEAGSIDKDDFCALLKHKTGKEIVKAFSSYVVKTRQMLKVDEIQASTLENKVKELRERLLQCTKALKLINSTCDRTLDHIVPMWCLGDAE